MFSEELKANEGRKNASEGRLYSPCSFEDPGAVGVRAVKQMCSESQSYSIEAVHSVPYLQHSGRLKYTLRTKMSHSTGIKLFVLKKEVK